jgi:hypothetical protein
MKAKCGLFALLFVLSSIVASAQFFVSSVDAVPPQPVTCVNDGVGTSSSTINLNWDWRQKIIDNFDNYYPTDTKPDFGSGSYIIFKGGAFDDFVIFYADKKFKLTATDTKVYISMVEVGNFYDMRVYKDSYQPPQNNTVTVSKGNNLQGYQLTGNHSCVYNARNVIYDTSYQNQGLNEYSSQKVPSTQVECDIIDVACWVGSLADNIVNSIQDFWNGIVQIFEKFIDFLSTVFIPSEDNLFATAFTDLQTYLNTKLGFLTYPFVFVSQQFSAILSGINGNGTGDLIHCERGQAVYDAICDGICAPNVFKDVPLCIRVAELERSAPTIWNIGIFVFRISVVVSLIELMRRKYMKVVSGGDE